MKTSSNLAFEKYRMKLDYQRAVYSETSDSISAPFDFNSIDAPRHIAAGAMFSSEIVPGFYIGLVRLTHRGAV